MPHKIILGPIVTERAHYLRAQNKYIFSVLPSANKIQVKNAIERAFNVNVLDVNTMICKGKKKKRGRIEGRRKDIKKAIVTIKEGQSIGIFEGL